MLICESTLGKTYVKLAKKKQLYTVVYTALESAISKAVSVIKVLTARLLAYPRHYVPWAVVNQPRQEMLKSKV